jgi:hypothetical protein
LETVAPQLGPPILTVEEHFVFKHFLQYKRNMSCPSRQPAVCKPDLKLMEEQPSNCTINICTICFYVFDIDSDDDRNSNVNNVLIL